MQRMVPGRTIGAFDPLGNSEDVEFDPCGPPQLPSQKGRNSRPRDNPTLIPFRAMVLSNEKDGKIADSLRGSDSVPIVAITSPTSGVMPVPDQIQNGPGWCAPRFPARPIGTTSRRSRC